ncbi:unnamed protein product, partial [Laminaria digitata]
MARTGHGLDTIKNASKSLETLKAGMGVKRQQSRRGCSPPSSGGSPGSFRPSARINSQTKPPLPLATKQSKVKPSKVKSSKSKPSTTTKLSEGQQSTTTQKPSATTKVSA